MESKAKQAVHYAKQGFRIVMLHGIDANGYCTCGKGEKCTSSGKHPIYSGWEKKATTAQTEILAEYFALRIPPVRNRIPPVHGNDTTC